MRSGVWGGDSRLTVGLLLVLNVTPLHWSALDEGETCPIGSKRGGDVTSKDREGSIFDLIANYD